MASRNAIKTELKSWRRNAETHPDEMQQLESKCGELAREMERAGFVFNMTVGNFFPGNNQERIVLTTRCVLLGDERVFQGMDVGFGAEAAFNAIIEAYSQAKEWITARSQVATLAA